MKEERTVVLFERWVEKLRLCYTAYIGDSDSNAYSSVCNAQRYWRLTFRKRRLRFTCHKDMGLRLRDITKSYKGM